jgi:hypothetical protein
MVTLLNLGAELSVINKKEAFTLGLPITYNYRLNINSVIIFILFYFVLL